MRKREWITCVTGNRLCRLPATGSRTCATANAAERGRHVFSQPGLQESGPGRWPSCRTDRIRPAFRLRPIPPGRRRGRFWCPTVIADRRAAPQGLRPATRS